MLIYSINEIVSFVICAGSVNAFEFPRLVLDSDIHHAAGGIQKSCNRLKPSFDIITIKTDLEFDSVVFQRVYTEQLCDCHQLLS